jgi:hypothetical protein
MKDYYQAAAADFTRAIELRRGFAEAYNNRAACRCFLREFDLAWADVRACQELGVQPQPGLVQMLVRATGARE